MEDRQKRGMEKMRPVIKEWELSGLTKKEFCSQQGIAQSVFHYWYKRCKQENNTGGFVPVRVSNPQADQISIHYPNGVIIKLPANMPPTLLRQYIYL